MKIKKIDPITEDFLVRQCISKKNQEKYLEKMIQGKTILYAGYENNTYLGVTGIEFDRKIEYLDSNKTKQICNCDYICAGYTFKNHRKMGVAKKILNYILENHLTDNNKIGITLTGNKTKAYCQKKILDKTFYKNLERGFQIKGYRPTHLRPFMILTKENYKNL